MFRLAPVTMLALASVVAADPPKPAVVVLDAQTEFARQVERAVRDNDTKAFGEFFASEVFLARSLTTLSPPAAVRKGFKRMTDTFGGRFFAQLVANAPVHRCGMKLLRVRVVDGEPRALFRSLTGDGGVNYLDLVLTAPGPDKPVRIADIHIAVTGELLSQTVATVLAKTLAAAEQNKGDAAGTEAEIKKLQSVARFMSLARSGKQAESLEAYEKLHADYKHEKVVMLAHVIITGNSREEDPVSYERAIDAFVKKYPADPAVELVSIDGYILKKKYAELQKAIDRLDKSVGGDPYLHVLRGAGLQLEGKPKEAKAAVGRAVAADPDLTPAYLALADIALAEKDFTELSRLLTVMEARFGIDFSNAATTDEYAEFRKSPEYKAWWGARKK